jgi:chromosome segregation and condensation protein ScpB
MIFKTTRRFLEMFGLRDIGDLPTIKELEALEK